MDYKKIIKKRSLRLKLLRTLSFVPDRLMLKFQYRIKTGRKLDLKNPKRYTEKIQWYKLYYKDPLMIQCVDKYDVRKYVEDCGLGVILNKCYGVYDNPEEINFDNLPDQYVLKDTLGSGGNSVLIVKDNRNLDRLDAVNQMKQWVKINNCMRDGGREWPYYSGKKHRIIIEEFIESKPENGGLIDYKFLCFYGKVALLYVLADRQIGQGAECGFFSSDFVQLPYTESDELPLKRYIPKPTNFYELKKVAERLSEPFPCARIDLYNEGEKIRFGEITYFDSSGYMTFDPDELDYELGKNFIISDDDR